MSLFNNLMSKIFGQASSSTTQTSAPASAPASTTSATPAASAPAATAPAPAAAPAQPVDVGAILDGLAAKNPEKLDWKHSIVDLMKLVGMDSKLERA